MSSLAIIRCGLDWHVFDLIVRWILKTVLLGRWEGNKVIDGLWVKVCLRWRREKKVNMDESVVRRMTVGNGGSKEEKQTYVEMVRRRRGGRE